jgi:hypothetical protein
MTVYTKGVLSGSTNGKGIKVVATSSPGTTIHTAVVGIASFDEIWIYAYNSDTVDHNLTVEWGGTTAPDDEILGVIPAQSGLYLVAPGLILQNGLIVKAWADIANKIVVQGWVNHIV